MGNKLRENSIDELHELYVQFCCPCDETGMYDKFLAAERANGLYIWFKGDDEPYLDLVMGYSALNFGHRYPEIIKIVEEAIRKIDHIHSFNSESKILLSKILAEKSPGDNNKKVYFPVGGAMAVEKAIRLARAYTGKRNIISLKGGFHGYSLGAMMLTDEIFINNKEQYSPYPGEQIQLPYADCYRCEYEKNCGIQCLEEAEEYLRRENEAAAIIVEPIQGAAGFIIPPKEFIVGLKRLCSDYNLLFIDDEVQVGLGRAGKMFAIEHFGVEPDIILLSKSLAGGYYPLSAVIAKSEIWDSISPQRSAIGSTFGNNPLGTFIALGVQNILEKERLVENAEKVGDYFTSRLKRFEEYEFIDNVTGFGLTQSFEVVEDKSTKTPAPKLARRIQSEALKQKVIIYVAGGGARSRIKLTLPLWVTQKDIDMIIERLEKILESSV